MTQRRFGPTNAPGVVIIETIPEKQILPGQLGVVGYLGVLEKGPVGELIQCSSKQSMIRKTGGLISESLLPDAGRDFWDMGQGSGLMFMVRTADGSEITSSLTLRNRRDPRGEVVKVDAKSPGRWGGKKRVMFMDMDTIATDLTETTLDTGWTPAAEIPENLWKDALLSLAGVPGRSYTVVASSAAGPTSGVLTLTVTSDSTMSSDLAAGGDPTNKAFEVDLANSGKSVAVLVKNGEIDPDNEFGVEVYVDGTLTLDYPDLSMDPNGSRYFVPTINDDDSNEEITVTDLWVGAITPDVRPANHYGVSTALTATVLTFSPPLQFVINSPGGADGTIGTWVLGGDMRPQQIVLTVTDDTISGSEVWGVASSINPKDDLPDATTAVAYTKPNELALGFTITDGATDWVNGDTITIDVMPFKQDALINGKVIPDTTERRIQFTITANDESTLTVRSSDDMTVDASPGDNFMVMAPQELFYGYDGLDALSDADFTQYLSPVDSPFNSLFGKNLGLVKMATPGVTATAIQKAGASYVEARNYQWRYEVPSNITTDEGADAWLNDTIGRNDFAVVAFPSFAYVTNPEGAGMKLTSQAGAIHGREALVARNFDGYHKAAAGTDVILSNILKLTTGERVLNEELLNPQGIQVIKFKEGNAIIWGDRTASVDPGWKWKHQRELMSYYENVLRENFDWIIFAINSPTVQALAFNALRGFFLPEFVKGALDNNLDLDEALQIKLDAENNPASERAAGNLHAEITLALADTIERFIITMNKAGIFETAA